ncbi:hypothetical protein CEXT_229351 [Caerostris extrusa]|uniref:Uncharacterized protein n=1 Tax=Caerostris extrusa TaxID=172846 RepID=A0AAV4XZS8_CAEEX|nr:hypothetical protein CEXT_229351 [Caerostris extrusa]
MMSSTSLSSHSYFQKAQLPCGTKGGTQLDIRQLIEFRVVALGLFYRQLQILPSSFDDDVFDQFIWSQLFSKSTTSMDNFLTSIIKRGIFVTSTDPENMSHNCPQQVRFIIFN